jgi:hypothetical protein
MIPSDSQGEGNEWETKTYGDNDNDKEGHDYLLIETGDLTMCVKKDI